MLRVDTTVAGDYIVIAANTKGVIDRLPSRESHFSSRKTKLQGFLLRTLLTTDDDTAGARARTGYSLDFYLHDSDEFGISFFSLSYIADPPVTTAPVTAISS